MQMISSAAGTRLARAKVALDKLHDRGPHDLDADDAWDEYVNAAEDLADELVAQGFHALDGAEK